MKYPVLSDVAVGDDRRLRKLAGTGFSLAEYHALLAQIASALSETPSSIRPRAAIIAVTSESNEVGVRGDAWRRVPPLASRLQTAFQFALVDRHGSELENIGLSAEVKERCRGGRIPRNLVSSIAEAVPNKLLIYVSGLRVEVFINGVLVDAYSDLCRREYEKAEAFIRKSALSKDLLKQFAIERLSRIGGSITVWYHPGLWLLVNRPEGAIERLLDDFLEARLASYVRIRVQEVSQQNGRLDVAIEYTDGVNDILELKWVGRSVSDSWAGSRREIADAFSLTPWESRGATVMRYSECRDGLRQLFLYLQSPHYQRGYLAVFDCHPDERRSTIDDKRWAAEIDDVDLPAVWEVWQVLVSPGSPSSKRRKQA